MAKYQILTNCSQPDTGMESTQIEADKMVTSDIDPFLHFFTGDEEVAVVHQAHTVYVKRI